MSNIHDILNRRLSENMAAHNSSHAPSGDGTKEHIQIQLDQIDPNPYQPRRFFDEAELGKLAESIHANGLVSPIEVRRVGSRYQIVHGERRLRAHKLLGKSSIESLLVNIDEKAMRAQALIENLQREDLCDFDVALALDAMKGDYASLTEMGNGLGIAREDLYRYLSFFDLPDAAVDFLTANHDVLGRAASYAIKPILAANGESEEASAVVLAALEKIKQGALNQKEAVSYIESQLQSKQKAPKKPAVEKNVISCGKKRLGTFQSSGGKLVLTLKESALSEDQRARLSAFLETLAQE